VISYLREQPRTQALADALRGTSATGAPPQLPQRASTLDSVSRPAPLPDYNQYGGAPGGDGKDGLSMLGKGIGKWAKGSSGNPFGDTNLGSAVRSGWDSISGVFGGAPSHSAATVRGGAPMAGGGGWMDSIKDMFGGAGGGAGASSGGGGMGGGMGSIYGTIDNLFGDKLYGKQEGNDETSATGDAARSALTSAAYSNPWSAAALWADRLLFKGKGMDTLTGWLD